MLNSRFPSPLVFGFDPRSTDTVLPLLLCQRVVKIEIPENMTSHVMPPRFMSEESSPVSVPNASAIMSVMPLRSVSDSSLLNVTSDVNVNVNALYRSVSAPSPVSSPSTRLTGLVDDPVTAGDAALSRSLGMFLAGRRNSVVGTKARQPLKRGLEALHSFRAAKNSGKHAFWGKAPKEILQRPVAITRPVATTQPVAIVPPEANVPRKKLTWPDEPEHEHVQADSSLKCCPVCLAALEGRTPLSNAGARIEATRQEERDPLQVPRELGVDWEPENFAIPVIELFEAAFGDDAGEARGRLGLILRMYNPSEAEKLEAKAILQILLGLPSLPDVEFRDRSSYVESLFGTETARRLDFAGDPFIASLATISEALIGTDAIDVEDSEREPGDDQFALQECDSDAPEESLGQFSQMYYGTFRQEMGSEDDSEDAAQESPRRGALTVRNL